MKSPKLTPFIGINILSLLIFLKASLPIAAQTLTSFSFNNFAAGGAKIAGQPFQITITAKDENGSTLTSFNNQINLSDDSATIYPTQTSEFTNGLWTGFVYITQAYVDDAITATYLTVSDASVDFTITADSRIKLLTASAGNNQAGTVATLLPQAITTRVVDPYNNPIPSVNVNFTISSVPPGATNYSLGNTSDTTDANGLASTTLTLGRKAGTYIVSSDLANSVSQPVSFFETANSGILLTIKLTPGAGVVPGSGYLAFTAKGYDQYLNEKPLSNLAWSVQNGGGTIDNTGIFFAGTTVGTYTNTVRAQNNSVGALASVSVIGTGEGTSEGGGEGYGIGFGEGTQATTSAVPSQPEGVLNAIVIDPSVISALQNLQIPIYATGVDTYGNAVSGVSYSFGISGALGTLTQVSENVAILTTSGTGVGTITVTATQGDIIRMASIVGSIGNGLDRRLIIEDITSPQTVGEPFTISIAAKDSQNNFITDYTGPIILADTTGTIDPQIVQPNDQGLWYVQAIISLAHSQVSITAAGDGMVGVSNIFEVLGDPKQDDFPPFGNAGGGGGVLGEAITAKLRELLTDKDLNKYTIARYIGAGLAAGIGILGASVGGGIMASRGLEALGRNPFAKTRLKLNLYLSITAFVAAAGLAVFAAFLIVK